MGHHRRGGPGRARGLGQRDRGLRRLALVLQPRPASDVPDSAVGPARPLAGEPARRARSARHELVAHPQARARRRTSAVARSPGTWYQCRPARDSLRHRRDRDAGRPCAGLRGQQPVDDDPLVPPRHVVRLPRSDLQLGCGLLHLPPPVLSIPRRVAPRPVRRDATRQHRYLSHRRPHPGQGDRYPSFHAWGAVPPGQGRRLPVAALRPAPDNARRRVRRRVYRRERAHPATALADRRRRRVRRAPGGERLRPPLAMVAHRCGRVGAARLPRTVLPGPRPALHGPAQRAGPRTALHRAQHPRHALRVRAGGREGIVLRGHWQPVAGQTRGELRHD